MWCWRLSSWGKEFFYELLNGFMGCIHFFVFGCYVDFGYVFVKSCVFFVLGVCGYGFGVLYCWW